MTLQPLNVPERTPLVESAQVFPGTCYRAVDGDRLLGFVAIDSTVGGRARGGLRMVPDLVQAEIEDAARAMTLKYGLLGLPQGGAKAGIIGDGEATPDQKRDRLACFARAAAWLLHDRTFVPDPDLGTDATDIRWMMQSLGLAVRRRDWRANQSGAYTARSCLAAADALFTRLGLPWRDCRVAIEGFGKVGSALAQLVDARGGRVVAVSTSRGALHRARGLDVRRLVGQAAVKGSTFVLDEPGALPPAALFDLPADVLFPCARRHGIHRDNVDRLSVRAVCAGANNPVTAEAEAALQGRGILYPPDFVSNCGGVLGGTLEFAGVPFSRIGPLIDGPVRHWTARFLDEGGRLGVSPRRVAEAEALARHADVRRRAEHPGVVQRLVSIGLEAYRREWVPEWLAAALAPRFLARNWGDASVRRAHRLDR